VLKLFGEGVLKIMTKLINTICATGEWPKDFTKVTMIALKKKPLATKCSDHRTVSLIAHTAKIVAKIFRRRIEKKIEDVLGDQFGFRRGKGTRDAIRMLRIISERNLEIDEELSIFDFKLSPCSVCCKFFSGYFPASEFYKPTFRNTLSVLDYEDGIDREFRNVGL
jgi:hypothetical protein